MCPKQQAIPGASGRVEVALMPLCVALCLVAAGASPVASESLGGAPVCEASTILRIACAQAPEGCWLVGDNEVRDRLFLYPISAGGRPQVSDRTEIDIGPLLAPPGELPDIEALARLESGEVLVYGSHSRNKHCKVRKKRRGFVGLRLEGTVAVAGQVGFTRAGSDLVWATAFGPEAAGDLARVAAAVQAGEAAAEGGDCSQAFDLEAAVAVPGPGREQVWLGLRSPLVDDHAVLLRHDVGAAALRFSDARLVATGGAGIRGLARDGHWIYGLSASPDTKVRPFMLWRFPAAALVGAATDGPIRVEEVAEVATRSEGVGIVASAGPGVAIVIQDGKSGTPTCDVESTFERVPLPPDRDYLRRP
jgi:hypothetical protein